MGSLTFQPSKSLSDRDWFIQQTWGLKRCEACGGCPVNVQASIYMPLSVVQRLDMTGLLLGKYGDGFYLKKKFSTERWFFIGNRYACADCEKSLSQLLAATLDSSAYVDFIRPPPARRIISLA